MCTVKSLVLGLLLFCTFGYTQATTPCPIKNYTCPPAFSIYYLNFSHWDSFLKKVVIVNQTLEGISGVNAVNYTRVPNDPDFLIFGWQVENAQVSTDFSIEEWHAFWINVYNYLAIRMIVKNRCATDMIGDCQPLTSIRQIGEQQPSIIHSTVWSLPELSIPSINNGSLLSLNDIEDNMLRNNSHYKEDVRIHTCIVCASISCPNLRNEAYTVANLSTQMSANAYEFLSNKQKGAKVEGSTLYLSAIFSWFTSDFWNHTKKPYDPNNDGYAPAWFLREHGPQEVVDYINKQQMKPGVDNPIFNPQYFSYNWDVNGYTNDLCDVDRACFPWWALVILLFGSVIALFLIIYCVKKRLRRKNNRGYESINSS